MQKMTYQQWRSGTSLTFFSWLDHREKAFIVCENYSLMLKELETLELSMRNIQTIIVWKVLKGGKSETGYPLYYDVANTYRYCCFS